MYEEDDLLECVKVTKDNHEELNVGRLYVVAGISEYDGNIVYTVRDTLSGKLHHSIDRFKYWNSKDVESELSRIGRGIDAYWTSCKEESTPKDNVNHPSHYESSCSIECIDAMEIAFGMDEVYAFCKLNAFKYIWRHKNKNGWEDLEKALWYINKGKEMLYKMYGYTEDESLDKMYKMIDDLNQIIK